ncbi:alpha/beta hydrolase [Clostridium sardiniense]|uniref:alpha/beta hydrolase n=1 Tax=Clostridium sardiniense TaxID=29369 RepID=UPI003D32EA26
MDVNKKCSKSIHFRAFRVINDILVSRKDKRCKVPSNIISRLDIPYDKEKSICKLDIHKPRFIGKSLPIIIYYHGGGWAVGDKSIYRNFCSLLSGKGFIVFNINYELTSNKPHPEPMKDCIKGAEWVYKHAKTYGGDRNNIFIIGDSAGGHIAGLIGALCTNKNMRDTYKKKYNVELSFKDELRAIGMLCGLSDFRSCYDMKVHYMKVPIMRQFTEMLLNTESIDDSEIGNELSVAKNMTKDFPKTFVTTVESDPVHCESLDIEKALIENKISYRLVAFDKSHKKLWHIYQLDQSLPESQRCLDEMIDYFIKSQK